MTNIFVPGGATFRSAGSRRQPHTTLAVNGGMRVGLSDKTAIPPNRIFGPVTVLKYAVNDLERWMEELASLGIGPWWVSRDQAPDQFIFRGRQSDTRFVWGLTWSGDVMHEIIQPLDDLPSPYREFLDDGREGLHHGAFYPHDYDAAVLYLRNLGKSPILHGHSGDARFVYFEGIGSPAQPIELQYLPSDVRAKHEVLKRASSDWDGSDPFRGPPRQWW